MKQLTAFLLCLALAFLPCASGDTVIVVGQKVTAAGGGYDADAQDFFDRVATNGGTISTATKGYVNTFVLAAKADSYWTKLTRINLFCGDDLAAAMTPLKVGGGDDPETNVNFVGGDYSEATGLTGNGSTKYLNTGLLADALSANDTHIALYNRASSANGGRHGAADSGELFIVYAPYSDGTFYSDMYDENTDRTSAATGGTPYGFLVSTRRSTTAHEIYRNGSSLATNTTAVTGTLPTLEIYLFAANMATVVNHYNDAVLGAYSIGAGLTDTDVSNYSTDLNAFQTSLGRNSY
jgi:hypothetical protein